MQVFPSDKQFRSTQVASALLDFLRGNENALGLGGALLYHSFPRYRDDEGGIIVSDAVMISPFHGVIVFALTMEANELSPTELRRCNDVLEQVPSYVQSRLVKNRSLRQGPTRLAFDITPVVYAPVLKHAPEAEYSIATSNDALFSVLDDIRKQVKPLDEGMFKELTATLEGAKGLIRPKKRDLPTEDEHSKGKQAELVEAAITLFDQQQKHGMMGKITGPQRIRGLAGSGKTVVLAMMAAQMHLQNPNARIAYTFWTKSLYQHVKRLITRFYRQFDDRDPDWDSKLLVLHGWGSSSVPGLYSVACERHSVRPLSFQEAAGLSPLGDRFDAACKTLLKATTITPQFDYVFVDEGQDFPPSFLQLAHALARDGKLVLAYDDLQTIFQPVAPSNSDMFGKDAHGNPKVVFEEDIVLYKCYRNPREVLVSAHALGFGVYGTPVQMLESKEHWEDIGYVVKAGDFVPGSVINVERPKENSLEIVSERCSFDEIVKAQAFKSPVDEIASVAESIAKDIADGLCPEDILVASVDDRYAKRYLSGIEAALQEKGIRSNNLHSDTFGIRDFSKEGRVTLSTVHKAKGNEAFMVYVVGIDAVFNTADVRNRNMLFTAMTRAKGWVRLSGVGKPAESGLGELKLAHDNFPSLVFKYPDPGDLQVMKRDLAEAADKKLKARRLIEQLKEDLSDEEIEQILKETKSERGGKRGGYKKGGGE